jgi:hypothetical protein
MSSWSMSPPESTGLDKTSQPGGRFGRRSVDPQRAQAPFELRALDGVGGERDRALLRPRVARGVARTAEQLGVRRVERLVALERRIAEQRLEQPQARGARGQPDGDRAVELDHRRREGDSGGIAAAVPRMQERS